MRFYKVIEDGYILAIGKGNIGQEISNSEYNQLMGIVQNRPQGTGLTDYRLKTDLTWEEYAVEPPEPSEDINPEEMIDTLEGIL